MYIKDLRELGFTGFEKNSYIKFNMSKSQMGSDGMQRTIPRAKVL